jgi:hypothetical protein
MQRCNTMECTVKNRNKLIAAYISGELTEEESVVFENHYFQCEICRNELKIAHAAVDMIEREGRTLLSGVKKPVERPGYKRLKSFSNVPVLVRMGIAFAGVAAIILLVLLMVRVGRDGIHETIVSDEETHPPAKEDRIVIEDTVPHEDVPYTTDIYAELTGPSFDHIQYFERWMTDNVRIGNDKIESILSPANDEIFRNEEVAFTWRTAGEEQLLLKIINNREDTIYESEVEPAQDTLFTIRVPLETFPRSGLYYWRIEDETEVLFIGKFYYIVQGSD